MCQVGVIIQIGIIQNMELVGLQPLGKNKSIKSKQRHMHGKLLIGIEGTYCMNEDGYALKGNEKLIGAKTGRSLLHVLSGPLPQRHGPYTAQCTFLRMSP